jgi:dinuclear metal center YbgI/SA1388 family protein
MEELAPLDWAEAWDNVGLQVGDPGRAVSRVLVALEATDAVVAEAIQVRADLLVVHHPPIFKALKALRFDTPVGGRLVRLITAGIGLYAAHTNLDQAPGGTNDTLAGLAGLKEFSVLHKVGEANSGVPRGHGRIGRLAQATTVGAVAAQLKSALGLDHVAVVGDPDGAVTTVAVGAGAGGELVPHASRQGADVLITGDVKYHTAQDALDARLSMIDIGHYHSERIVVAPLAAYLRQRLSEDGHSVAVVEAQAATDPFCQL